MALVEWRNTPSVGMQSSPTQRLMPRRTGYTLLTRTSLLEPKMARGVKELFERKRMETEYSFDRRAKELPDLKIGEPVLMRTAGQQKTWEKATCMDKLPNRSYVTDTISQTPTHFF